MSQQHTDSVIWQLKVKLREIVWVVSRPTFVSCESSHLWQDVVITSFSFSASSFSRQLMSIHLTLFSLSRIQLSIFADISVSLTGKGQDYIMLTLLHTSSLSVALALLVLPLPPLFLKCTHNYSSCHILIQLVPLCLYTVSRGRAVV